MAILRIASRARRRYGALLALSLMLGGVLFLVPSAVAVHDLGLFELDRNAQAEATPGDDWGTLFGGGGSQESFTGILADSALPGNQFQGGGSKDDLDITQWLWKAGEPLDKDDITNAYAAAYTNTTDTGSNNVGDLIVYFGLDRFSVAGSAQVGFWFLQDPTFGLSDTASGGGFKFNGQHQDNDVLVQSNFTNGGVISNITVFKWLSGGLVQIAQAGDCVSTPPLAPDDQACATANQAASASPWPYTPKANEGSPGTFPISAFFEGGLNITRLVPDATCFSGFMAETRSSTPFDSRLKDFTLGTFESCEAEIKTTPSSASIVLGQSITDRAVVSASGLGGVPTPTGSVKFFICSPSQLSGGACPSPNGTFVDVGGDEPNGETLTPDPIDATKANAESDSFTPNVIGTWCWRGEYSGDQFYDPVTDASIGECFTVTDTSSITTDQKWLPNDTASVTTAGGTAVSGTVTFTLYENGTCSAPAKATFTDSSAPFETNNTSVYTSTQTISWRAHFESNNGVAASDSSCETSTVTINNNH